MNFCGPTRDLNLRSSASYAIALPSEPRNASSNHGRKFTLRTPWRGILAAIAHVVCWYVHGNVLLITTVVLLVTRNTLKIR